MACWAQEVTDEAEMMAALGERGQVGAPMATVAVSQELLEKLEVRRQILLQARLLRVALGLLFRRTTRTSRARGPQPLSGSGLMGSRLEVRSRGRCGAQLEVAT